MQKFWRDPPSGGVKEGWSGESNLFSNFMCQYLENSGRYRPKLLLMTVLIDIHSIHTEVDDLGWLWTRWRTAAIVFKYLNQHNSAAVYSIETWCLVLRWGVRLSLDFYYRVLHARIVVMRRPNRCVSWAFFNYTVKINDLLVRLTWK